MSEPTLRRSPHVRTEAIEGETVLYDRTTGAVVHLDRTATAVWSCFAQPAQPAAVARVLAARYSAPVDRVTRDVGALVERLSADGLLRHLGATASSREGD